jgi:hypothetical protein
MIPWLCSWIVLVAEVDERRLVQALMSCLMARAWV